MLLKLLHKLRIKLSSLKLLIKSQFFTWLFNCEAFIATKPRHELADFIQENILLHLSESIRFFASSSLYLSMGFACSNSVASNLKEYIVTKNQSSNKK